MKRFVLMAALALLPAASLSAKPADYATLLANPDRSEAHRKLDELRQPAEVLDFAGLRKGQKVADYFAGSGYFTVLLSQAVGPKGRVIAMNQANFVKPKNWEKLRARYTNVDSIIQPIETMTLPGNSVDMIFTHLVWHDLYWVDAKNLHPRQDVPATLANWHKALRKGGTVVVVDHVGPKGDVWDVVERLHRIDPEQVKADMKKAGFKLVGESQVLRNPQDSHEINVFDKSIRGRTDRFMLKFRKV